MNMAVAVQTSNTVPPVVSSVQEIPLRSIQESKTNPRRQFDDGKLAELAGFVPGNKMLCNMSGDWTPRLSPSLRRQAALALNWVTSQYSSFR
jgi:hypothetical protein